MDRRIFRHKASAYRHKRNPVLAAGDIIRVKDSFQEGRCPQRINRAICWYLFRLFTLQ